MASPLITIQNVRKQFGEGVVAVEDMTLAINDGNFRSLLGPSLMWQIDRAQDDCGPAACHPRAHPDRPAAGQCGKRGWGSCFRNRR